MCFLFLGEGGPGGYFRKDLCWEKVKKKKRIFVGKSKKRKIFVVKRKKFFVQFSKTYNGLSE